MASAIATEHIGSRHKIEAKVATGATTVTSTWVPMADYRQFAALAVLAGKTGNGITKLEILASAASGGTNPVVVKDSGTIAADAVGDQAFQEMDVAELAALGTDLAYVAAKVTLHNQADVAALTYIRTGARQQTSGLTPATTIA